MRIVISLLSLQDSIDSDFQESQLDLEEEQWRREVDNVPKETVNIRMERNGRTRRNDPSKSEGSMRSVVKESENLEVREMKELRDASVGTLDTKESGCQTRDSLFQTDPPPSSNGKFVRISFKLIYIIYISSKK